MHRLAHRLVGNLTAPARIAVALRLVGNFGHLVPSVTLAAIPLHRRGLLRLLAGERYRPIWGYVRTISRAS
jgi:hypothetical protein